MSHHKPSPVTLLLCAAFTLMVLLPAQAAFAQEDAKTLLKYTPDKSGVVVGMNLAKARSTTFYKEGIKLLNTAPDFQKLRTTLEEDISLDIEKDIHAIVAVAPKPTSSKSADNTVAVVLSGKFDKKKIVEKLEADKTPSRELGKQTVYQDTDGDSEIMIVSNELIVITVGKQSYRDKAFKAAQAGKKAKVPKSVKSLAKRVNTSKHLWFVMDASSATKSNPEQPKLIAMTMDFAKGLGLKAFVRMQNEEEAQKMLSQYTENKEQFEGGAVMVGAPSFAKNFKIEAKKADITITSSMPDKEVKSVATWGLGMLESSKR